MCSQSLRSPGEVILRVSHAGFRYAKGGQTALHDVSFDGRRGDPRPRRPGRRQQLLAAAGLTGINGAQLLALQDYARVCSGAKETDAIPNP